MQDHGIGKQANLKQCKSSSLRVIIIEMPITTTRIILLLSLPLTLTYLHPKFVTVLKIKYI